LLGCDDRLEAPNDAATFEIAKPALLALGAQLFATDDPTSLAVSQAGEPRSAFRARLRHHKPSDCKVDLASIAQRLARGPGQA
jgi:hypothetical protein